MIGCLLWPAALDAAITVIWVLSEYYIDIPHLFRIILIFVAKLDIFSLRTQNLNWWEKNNFSPILFKTSIFVVNQVDSQNMYISNSAFQKIKRKTFFIGKRSTLF